MWKVVARGIRETLERRVCRTNVYSQSSQDNAKNEVKTNLACQQKFLAPIFCTFNKGFCGSAKSTGAKDKGQDRWNTNYNWSEAFGWSSVLAAGWIVCQSLSLNKRVFDKDNERKSKLIDYIGVSNILQQLSSLKLIHILPVTDCVGNGRKNLQNSDRNTSKQFGPITSEEAFKEAVDEFASVHKMMVGEFELRYGLKALEEKRYKDALTHFSRGAKQSSLASMFNLGLCYELGIGTLADQKKAAKYYNDAAEHGHADALYNLGVFHAQGKGDFSVDIDTARTYFIRAAKLGQAQAQHALDLEKIEIRRKKVNGISSMPKASLENADFETNRTSNACGKLLDYDDKLNASLVAQLARKVPERDEGTAKSPTQIFLEFLGIAEPNPAPVLMTTNDCHVY